MSERPNRLHNRKGLKERRRQLRNNATPAEAALWKGLRGSRLAGRKFRRQHSIGPYIVDFYCPSERLVIELDGAPHDDPIRHTYDTSRQRFLEGKGLTVLRLENRWVFQTPDKVLEAIAHHFSNEEAGGA